jgi:glycosyltransferase involved in cell wall biosynthesis
VIHQFRQAYDLYDTENGLKHYPNGDDLRELIVNIDNQTLPESKLIYGISKNISHRLKKYNNINSEPLYHPPMSAGRLKSESYSDYILSVGRLDSLKRVDLLVNALQYCDRSIKVLIAGAGNETENLSKLAHNLNIEDRVEFLGFVSDEDVVNLYANCFSVFFAPFDEDYGYVTLESFLSKKPVVTCVDSGGVLEFVTHEENGYVSNPDPKEIAESINKLYSDKRVCQEFGNNGHDLVKDISWDNAIEKLTSTL